MFGAPGGEDTRVRNEIIDSLHLGVVLVRAVDSRIAHANPRFHEMFGYSDGELGGRPISIVVAPGDRSPEDQVAQMHAELLREGWWEGEVCNVRKDGSHLWCRVCISKFEHPELGTVWVGLQQDVTEQKQAKEQLSRSRSLLRAIVEGTADAVYAKDREGRYLLFNPAAQRAAGRSEGGVLGKDDTSWLPPAEAREVMTYDRRVIGEKRSLTFEETVHAVDGVRVYQSTKGPILDDRGNALGLFGISRDITDRKRTEDQLRLHSAMLATMAEGVQLTRVSDSVIIYANPAFERMFGYDRGELDGKHVSTLNAEGPTSAEEKAREIQRVLEETGCWSGEILNRRKDGTPFWCWAAVSTFQHSAHGDVWVSAHTDITERKEIEEKIRRLNAELEVRVTERTAELDRRNEELRVLSRRLVEAQESERRSLARELHDEVGQVLTGLSLSLEAGLRAGRVTKRSVRSALGLVSDLLKRVRSMSLDLRPAMLDDLGLVDTLHWHLGRFTEQTRIRVAFSCTEPHRRFPADVELVAYRIIQEALTNVARHAGVDQVAVSLRTDGEQLEIEVEDRGAGLSLTSAAASWGSGLRNIAERAKFLGGGVVIDSEPGAGTRLKARLPLSGAAPGAVAKTAEDARE